MKSIFSSTPCLLAMIAMLFCPCFLQAQSDSAGGGRRLSFLTADDRIHFLKVRQQVLASDPTLKTEQESLEKERQTVKGAGTAATKEDRQTLRENSRAHFEKMKAAMLKADPSIGPVLDQIRAQRKTRMEKHEGAEDGSAS